MIKLNLKKDPYWIELAEGIRIRVRPASTFIVMAARAASQKDIGDSREAALLHRLAEASILEWEGVGDADGNPAAVTPEYVGALMAEWPLANAFETKYLTPALILQNIVEQEKNV